MIASKGQLYDESVERGVGAKFDAVRLDGADKNDLENAMEPSEMTRRHTEEIRRDEKAAMIT